MDDNPEKQLHKKTKLTDCQKTVGSLLDEYESLLQKQKQVQTGTTGDSDHPVKQEDATKQMNDIELAMESTQRQIKLALEKHHNTQSTSEDCSVIQSVDKQLQDAKFLINQQVGQPDDNNAQNEANPNPDDQALLKFKLNGILPEEVYLHLMSVTGVQDCLINNRLICPLWNELVMERCRNQPSLKLFESFHILMEYGEMLLKYEKMDDASLILNSVGDDLLFEKPGISHGQFLNILHQDGEKKLEASKVLTTFFPRVNQLVLCTESNSLIDIEHFLQFYAKQLTSLTMTDFGQRYEHPGSKLRAFNFPKLKSLHTFYFSPHDDQLLSLLPQLESLTLHSLRISLETLLRTGTQLQELNMYNLKSAYTSTVKPFSKCPPIKTNLRKLSFMTTTNLSRVLEFISRNLTSLSGLKLYFDCERDNVRHLNSLTSYLLPLHQLHSLTLQAPVSFFLLDDNQLANIQPQKSVRHLKLQLSDYDSLSMDLFSRAIFAAFPKVKKIGIAFVGDNCNTADGCVDTATFAAFEGFASKHPKVVQLFRSKKLSKFTSLPNAVSPLLGHRRQMYEEYIEEEELFGVPICKLTKSLVPRQGADGPNLKIALRAADRLSAMSNLCQLLESKAFALTCHRAEMMLMQQFACAFKCGPSDGELFKVTCHCVLNILASEVIIEDYSSDETRWLSFLQMAGGEVYPFFRKMVDLVEHYKTQQFSDSDLLFQICKRAVRLLEYYSLNDKDEDEHGNEYGDEEEEEEDEDTENTQFHLQYLLKILMDLSDLYKTEELSFCEDNGGEDLLLQIRDLMDDQLEKLNNEHLVKVINDFICGHNRVYRVEMALLLLQRHGE